MRFNQMLSVGSLSVLIASIGVAPPVLAQSSLQAVRDLYASAAYEDALAAVGKLDGEGADLDQAEQYRVFSLIALGRMQEAELAVEAVLMEHPEYKLDPSEASPRIQALYKDVRQRVGPALVKRMYQLARAAMERKDREDAIAKFDAMLRLANAEEVRNNATVAELKELGAGFLELSRALPAKAPQPVAEAAPTSGVASRTHVIVPPTVIQQRLPRWVPDPGSRATVFQGAVRVQISAEGKVVAAEILKSVHPTYDHLLLRAARGWQYRPAQKDGVPIPIDKTVEINFAPASDASRGGDKSQPF